MVKISNLFKKNQKLIPLFILNISIFFDFLIFLICFIFFFIILFKKNTEFTRQERIGLKVIPINYYLFSFFNTFNENNNSSIFWDMQNFTHYLRCNKSKFVHTYMNNKVNESCWETIGYGPLSEILIFPFDGIWIFVLILAVLFTLFVLIYLINAKEDLLIIVSILISPGFHFMYFGLSTDIFVVLFILYLFKKSDLNFSILDFLILTFLTQLKSFPIFIFLGYIIIFFIKKQYKYFLISTIFFLVNLSFLFNHYFLQKYFLPEPMSYTRSFGLLHDYKLLFNHIDFDEAIIVALILCIILGFKYQKIKDLFLIDEKISYEILFLFPTTLFINLYQNWGYKFVFNSILIYFIYKHVNKNTKLYLILVNLFATSYYTIGWGFEPTNLNYLIISVSKVLFYSYFIFSIIIFLKQIRKSLN